MPEDIPVTQKAKHLPSKPFIRFKSTYIPEEVF